MVSAERFKAWMAAFAELSGTQISMALSDIYWRAFEPYSDDQVARAIDCGIRKWTCFSYGRNPAPAQIIEEIEGAQGDPALIAWELLEHAISSRGACSSVLFTDPKISRVVVAMGGWIEVCRWTIEETTKWRRNEFMKLYRGAGNECDQQVLPGTHELENRARGFFHAIPDPEVIGDGPVKLMLPQTQRQRLVEHCVNTLLTDPPPKAEEKDGESE